MRIPDEFADDGEVLDGQASKLGNEPVDNGCVGFRGQLFVDVHASTTN